MKTNLIRPSAVVAVAGEIVRVRPDDDGWRVISEADLQQSLAYKSRRSIESAVVELAEIGMIELGPLLGRDGRGHRMVKVLDNKRWASVVALVELVEVWA